MELKSYAVDTSNKIEAALVFKPTNRGSTDRWVTEEDPFYVLYKGYIQAYRCAYSDRYTARSLREAPTTER